MVICEQACPGPHGLQIGMRVRRADYDSQLLQQSPLDPLYLLRLPSNTRGGLFGEVQASFLWCFYSQQKFGNRLFCVPKGSLRAKCRRVRKLLRQLSPGRICADLLYFPLH